MFGLELDKADAMSSFLRLTISTAALAACLSALAVDRPAACASAEARRFDFWPGAWRVESRYRTGAEQWLETTGRWRAESVVGGCVIIDFADGAFAGEPMRGMGTRYWDPDAEEWVVTWISTAAPGRWQEWRGTFAGDIGNFYSRRSAGDDETFSRLQWRDIESDSARWSFAITRDGGETWTVHWTMAFRREIELD